jgi:heme exporter protein D
MSWLYWSNVDDFLAMGGYGLYVWGSSAVFGGALAAEVLALRLRAKGRR